MGINESARNTHFKLHTLSLDFPYLHQMSWQQLPQSQWLCLRLRQTSVCWQPQIKWQMGDRDVSARQGQKLHLVDSFGHRHSFFFSFFFFFFWWTDKKITNIKQLMILIPQLHLSIVFRDGQMFVDTSLGLCWLSFYLDNHQRWVFNSEHARSKVTDFI